MGTEGVCLAAKGSQSSLHPGGGEGWPSELGRPSPLPPERHWVVSHFPLDQFHSPVKPAVKAPWDGGRSRGKEVGEGINTPPVDTAPPCETTRKRSREKASYR